MGMYPKLTAFALGATLILPIAGPALAMSDSEFMSTAVKGDNSEIELGKLALAKGNNESVKTFARMIIEDHSKHKAEATTVAKQVGVAPTDDVAPDAKSSYAKLQGLSGAQFDKAYVDDMVKDHEKDIAEYKAEASSGSGAVQKLATQTLPTLQKHLDEAKSLQGKV